MIMPLSRASWLAIIFAVLAIMVVGDRSWTSSATDSKKASTTTDQIAALDAGGKTNAISNVKTPTSALSIPATPMLGTSINALATLELSQLRDTLARPLFSPTRRPYRRPVARKKPKPPARKIMPRQLAPNPFVVRGIMMNGSRRIALLHDKSAARNRAVSQGEKLGPWRVTRIGQQSVTLRQEERSVTLRVFKQKVDARTDR